MNSVDIGTFKDYFDDIIKQIIENGDSFKVKSNKGNAIVISKFEYKSMLEMCSQSFNKDLIARIKEGENEDLDSMPKYNPNAKW